MSSQVIERAVQRALRDYGGGLPVDVGAIASRLGIEIVKTPFPENPDLSGVLVREHRHTFMAINEAQSEPRQRFTIAHEIGHFLLDEAKAVWIDKGVHPVSYRRTGDGGTPEAYKLEEVRANRFAAELLMPSQEVERRFADHTGQGADWEGSKDLLDIANEFEVSLQAMAIRLRELGLLTIPGY